MRLLVILADHLGELVRRKEEAAHCLDRRATWRSRISALRDLLNATRVLSQHYAVLVDPDALAPATRLDWDDRTLHRMREDIRKTIFSAVDAGGWLIAQPNPTRLVTEEIDQVNIEPEEAGQTADPALAFFAPDVQPIARWLVETHRIPRERLPTILEDTRDPSLYILRIVYDALPETARECARRLQGLRAPIDRNGKLGPFDWAVTPRRSLDVAPNDVDILVRAGVLTNDDERFPARLVMPRRVRETFAIHANVMDADALHDLHEAVAADEMFSDRSVEHKIEIHHHAALAENLSRLTETAEYFGIELRALASRTSREKHDYEGAAALFRKLVEDFDNSDAYAWEYLGYNLARADAKAKARGKRADDILAAYKTAHELDKKNPLYHGRLLGYRAEQGCPVIDEINAAMAKYAERSDAGNLVSWFVKPVLDGLYRGKQHDARAKILDTWGMLLEWSAPGVLQKHGAGEE